MQVQRKAEPGPWGKNESTVFGANRRAEGDLAAEVGRHQITEGSASHGQGFNFILRVMEVIRVLSRK